MKPVNSTPHRLTCSLVPESMTMHDLTDILGQIDDATQTACVCYLYANSLLSDDKGRKKGALMSSRRDNSVVVICTLSNFDVVLGEW